MARIRGLDRWIVRMERVPENVEDDVKQLVEETAYKIEADAKMLCPVDTGHLRRSIKTKLYGLAASIGVGLDYAGYVEFGTSEIDAQPFLFPAYIKHLPHFEAELRRILSRRVGD